MERRCEQQPGPPAADVTVLGSLLKTSGRAEPLCADRSLKLSNRFISKPKSSTADFKGRKRRGGGGELKALDHTIWSVTHPDKTPPPLPANRPLNEKEIMVILKQTALLLSVSNYFCHIVMKHWKWCNLQKYSGVLTFLTAALIGTNGAVDERKKFSLL